MSDDEMGWHSITNRDLRGLGHVGDGPMASSRPMEISNPYLGTGQSVMKVLHWLCSRGLHWYVELDDRKRTCAVCRIVTVNGRSLGL